MFIQCVDVLALELLVLFVNLVKGIKHSQLIIISQLGCILITVSLSSTTLFTCRWEEMGECGQQVLLSLQMFAVWDFELQIEGRQTEAA